MDLSSMLNQDSDSKSAGPSSVTPLNQDRPPTPPQDTQSTVTTTDDTCNPRKRQRIENPPSPSSVALPIPTKPLPPPTAGETGVSPLQTFKGLPSQNSPSRNSSVSTVTHFLEGFEPSIINVQPSEELTRFVSDFIFVNLNEEGYENLEVPTLSWNLAN
jgi:hypothetical protein